MKAADRTKKVIAEALNVLADQYCLDKITVKQICETAGVSRQTFYAHFRDKYDAAYWRVGMFTRDIFARLGTEIGWRQAYLQCFREVEALSSSLRALIVSDDYNSIRNTTIRASREDFLSAFRRVYGTKPDGLVAYQIERFSIAASWATDDWIERGCDPSAEQFVDMFISLIPRELFNALDADA